MKKVRPSNRNHTLAMSKNVKENEEGMIRGKKEENKNRHTFSLVSDGAFLRASSARQRGFSRTWARLLFCIYLYKTDRHNIGKARRLRNNRVTRTNDRASHVALKFRLEIAFSFVYRRRRAVESLGGTWGRLLVDGAPSITLFRRRCESKRL